MKDLCMEDHCMKGKWHNKPWHDSGHLKEVKPGEDEEHQIKDISAPVIDRQKQKGFEKSFLVWLVKLKKWEEVSWWCI